MGKMRSWFWEIEAQGQGPDCIFTARFNQSEAELLMTIVQQNLPSSYLANTELFRVSRPRNCAIYASYLDRHTHSRFAEMAAMGQRDNIYYGGEIQICDHTISIENSLSVGLYDETGLLIAIAQTAGLTMSEWSVAYSGYSWGKVARGSSAIELLAYLQDSDETGD